MRYDMQSQAQPDISKKEIAQEPAKKESRGERLYNATVYWGINYFLNLAISLISADYFINLSGKKHLDKSINYLSKGVSSLKIFSRPTSEKISRVAMETMAQTSGGVALLVPTKLMEDRKRPIVHWLNKHVFKDKQLAADGHEQTPDEIYIEKEQPRQTWWNVFKRRIYASIVIVGSGNALEYTLGRQKTTNFIVNQANKLFKSGVMPGGRWLATNPGAQRYLNFAALDTIFTAINAVVMYLTNGAKKAPDAGKPVAVSEAAALVINKAEGIAAPPPDHERLSGYKKRTIVPAGNHADLANPRESDYMMAP